MILADVHQLIFLPHEEAETWGLLRYGCPWLLPCVAEHGILIFLQVAAVHHA